MKLTITTTYAATRMSIKQLLESECYGWFIGNVNESPCRISDNLDWLKAQNPRTMVYHLDDEEECAVLK